MSATRWLIPGIWLVMLLSLGILLYTNAEIKAGQQNENFSLQGNAQAELKVNSDGRRLVDITLYKRFTTAEQEFLATVVAGDGQAIGKLMGYQLQFPLLACEFSAGLLLHCDSKNSQRYSAAVPHKVSWLQENGQTVTLMPEQLPDNGLKLTFYTSREKHSRLDADGQRHNHCTLQAHLQISVFKSAQLSGVMAIEDAFFDLSERACVS